MPSNKKIRREAAIKKAKRKRNAIIAVCGVLVIAFIVFMIITIIDNAGTQTYSDGYASVVLRPNGRFTSTLYHNDRYTGTYTTSESGGATLVHFSQDNGGTAVGIITDGVFVIPDAWDDGHGHGSALPLR